jgi:diguanylate cyclase (GGDEF)-like protein
MPDRITELETRLKNAQTPRDEIDALNDLAWELIHHETERAMTLARKAHDLSNNGNFAKQPYHMGVASSLTIRAHLERKQGNLDLALDESFQALALLTAEIHRLRHEELSHEIEERKRLEAALNDLAIADPLTGLYNRRHFFNLAEMQLEQATRYERTLSVMVLDIDHFKQINDTYGHAVGDRVIKHLAGNIEPTIRRADVTARFGGDEFVILMPETDSSQAVHLAERLQHQVAEKTISAKQSSFHLTLSIGVASSSAHNHVASIDVLLEMADHALYQAKESGGNRVCIYEPKQKPS